MLNVNAGGGAGPWGRGQVVERRLGGGVSDGRALRFQVR